MTKKPASGSSRRLVVAGLALVTGTLLVFAPVRHHDFIAFDDPAYVTANPEVTAGITGHGARWAFTATHAGNWHPLTWLSHMVDAELFGPDAGGHHLTSLFLHIANTLLLFGLLARMTDQPGRSAFVAGLFAVHPLHVESVAWIAERKDVLSMFFGLVTLWAYVVYVSRPRLARYLVVVVTFGLGLMAKPMLVTLPFVMLLLDIWPLGRTAADRARPAESWRTLVLEKVPLLALVVVSSLVTLLAQGTSVRTLDEIPWPLRVANALQSYVVYIFKMFWPTTLEPFYPYPQSVPVWVVAGAALGLAGVSMLAIRVRMNRPYLPVGWFWYLGTLVPVIGLVQVGRQAMADRYTYAPSIGLFIILAWGIPDLVARWPARRLVLPIASVLVMLACIVTARAQVDTWRNDITLWEHALRVDPDNATAHHSLGTALAAERRLDEAIAHNREAIRIDPGLAEAWTNLGATLAEQGHDDEAVAPYREAIRLLPGDVVPHINLGRSLARLGRTDEAMREFLDALRIDPGNADAHSSLGLVLARLGRWDEAIGHYTDALRANPRDALTYMQFGSALEAKGDVERAAQQYATAVSIDAGLAPAHTGLALALATLGRRDEAIREFLAALDITPDDAEGHYNVAITYLANGNFQDARRHLERAVTLAPTFAAARRALDDVIRRGRGSGQ